jgi:acetyl esterase/lipase
MPRASTYRIGASVPYGDLSVLPKTLLLTGTRDLLTPDNLIFAEKARAQGVDVQLFVEQACSTSGR